MTSIFTISAALRAPALLLGCALLSATTANAQESPERITPYDVGDFRHTGKNWVLGRVVAISATSSGILVSFKNNYVPTNCRQSGSYRILIRQENVAMTSLFTTMWASGRRDFRITTLPYTGTRPTNPYIPDRGDNYCAAIQLDAK